MALAVVFGYERQVFELGLRIGVLQHHEAGSPAAVRQAFKLAVDDGVDDGQDYRLVDGVGSVLLAQIGLLFFRVMALIVIVSHFLVVVQDYFEQRVDCDCIPLFLSLGRMGAKGKKDQ